MIIDCHAHVFEHWMGPCGHPTRDIHTKYLQRMLAHTVASVYRARDGAPADTKALLDPKDMGWSGLRAVNFRVGCFGQLEFTVDGEDYYAQYMPIGMQEMVAPPARMLAQMTYAGVDHAVLQAGGAYGAMTSYNCYTSIQYPKKFTALLHVDEAMGGTPEGVAEVERGAKLGAKGIYFNFEGFARYGFPWPLDDAKMDPLWDRLQALGLVLCTEISGGPTYDVAGYVNNILALGRVLDRFPRLPCHLAMGVPVQYFARGDHWDLPKDLETVYKRDDFYVEIMYPIAWGGRWDYPYREAHPLICDLRDRIGAEKLMWGSDMPNVERFCTYRQSLDYVRRYCDFLTGDEMDLILGKNAVRLYQIPDKE